MHTSWHTFVHWKIIDDFGTSETVYKKSLAMRQALRRISQVVCLLLMPDRLAFTPFDPKYNKESIKERQVLVDFD